MKDDLLQRLLTETGFRYLSDLHSSYHTRTVYSAVRRLSPDDYPVGEWEEAISYITGGQKRYFNTPDEAHRFLIQELERAWQYKGGSILLRR